MLKSQQSTTSSVQQMEQVTPMTSDSDGSSNIPPSRTTTTVALTSSEPQAQQVTPMILDSAGPANIPPSGTTTAVALTSSELRGQQVAPMILDSAGDAMTIPSSMTTTAVPVRNTQRCCSAAEWLQEALQNSCKEAGCSSRKFWLFRAAL